MPIIKITLNNKPYQVGCDEGQEARVLSLAETFNEKVRKIKSSSTQIEHELSIVLSALMLQDEIISLTNTVKNDNDYIATDKETDIIISEALDSISKYIENIAETIREEINK